MIRENNNITALRKSILDDLFKDFNTSRRWIRKILEPIAWPAATRFAKISDHLDYITKNSGIQEGMRQILPNFADCAHYKGNENIPVRGPLLIISNHPGTCDSIALCAGIPRDDLKVVATGFTMLRQLPHASEHMIFMEPHSQSNFTVVRSVIRHLRDGGAILIFPSGRVEPDPAHLPGAKKAIRTWSSSIEIFLEKVPFVKVQTAVVSGVFSPTFLKSPLINIWNGLHERQTTAEAIQVVTQLLFRNLVHITPDISFGIPRTVDELKIKSTSLYDAMLTEEAKLMDEHCGRLNLSVKN
jgi:1-acyl-sn-glycerol-3-phosphate acyltransferase